MSNTRHAKEGSVFRQEKFSSSEEFERGLMGNLVARRCAVLDAPADRDLVWFLQLLSHHPGGLEKVAADLLHKYPERVATKSMHAFGFKPGMIYTPQQARAICAEMGDAQSQFDARRDSLQKQAECARRSLELEYGNNGFDGPHCEERPDGDKTRQFNDFAGRCRQFAAENLTDWLSRMCLDPSMDLNVSGPWYFPALIPTLREYQTAWIEDKRVGCVVTELGAQVGAALDYAQQSRCLVLLDGQARTGKTHSTRAWCDQHPGAARYVQTPSGNDDMGFFRAIAKSLGVSISRNSKAQQLRDRIEDVLQRGGLAVVFDEAHYLWPQSSYRDTLPGRVNWIMTALVNYGVPVALVTTPQFMRTQAAIERKSCWTSEQFIGRIGHYQKLPDSLSAYDLSAVAKARLPEGCAKSIETLVVYAQGSCKYLAAIESVVNRARFLAQKQNRQKVTFADVRNAIKESVIPSDSALAVALADPPKSGRARAIAAPLRDRGSDGAAVRQRDGNARLSPKDLPDSQLPGTDRPRVDLTAV